MVTCGSEKWQAKRFVLKITARKKFTLRAWVLP